MTSFSDSHLHGYGFGHAFTFGAMRELTLSIVKWKKCNEKLLLGNIFFDHEHYLDGNMPKEGQ
jgi:hypothetical protein